MKDTMCGPKKSNLAEQFEQWCVNVSGLDTARDPDGFYYEDITEVAFTAWCEAVRLSTKDVVPEND